MTIKRTILTLLFFCAAIAWAQAQRFTVSVDKNPVATGDVLQVTFSIEGSADKFTAPDFKGFQFVGTSQSTSESTGAPTITSLTYELEAVNEGEFTIGSASLEVNGHTLTTKPIKIKVIKGVSVPHNQQAQQSQPEPAERSANKVNLAKSIFLKAVVDKNNVYVGQQIVLKYKLYTRLNVGNISATNAPEFNGFWNDNITPKQQNLVAHTEVVNGQRFNVADVTKFILLPEREGDLTIDPFGLQLAVSVPVQSDDPIAQFFGEAQETNYNIKSAPLTIHVKPLPATGKPDGFTGAVGNFKVESSIDKTELKANDALNYKVKVTGSGNLKLLKTLNVIFPSDFEKYDPKTIDTITEDENGESGSRIYNYLLIPRHQGQYTIDPLKFSYFNPATERYVTLTTKAFSIKVDKGASESNVTEFSDVEKQDLKMLSKDIRYIKLKDDTLVKNGDTFFGSIGYFLLLLIGPVLCYAAYVYRNRLIAQNSDLVKVKSRKAGRIAAKHMANAQKQLIAGDTTAFYENVFSGLYGYLSDKLNIQYADLNKEAILAGLKAKKVSDPLAARLMDTLDLCEMANYAPVTHISKQEVFEKAKNIISDIENEI